MRRHRFPRTTLVGFWCLIIASAVAVKHMLLEAPPPHVMNHGEMTIYLSFFIASMLCFMPRIISALLVKVLDVGPAWLTAWIRGKPADV